METKKAGPSKVAGLLSKKNMRIFNLIAIAMVIIGWIVRFYYFTKREEVVEQDVKVISTIGTEVTETQLVTKELQDSFMLMLYTLVIFPFLIFIFTIQELNVKVEKLAFVPRNFYFLDYYMGKAIYLLLLISLLL